MQQRKIYKKVKKLASKKYSKLTEIINTNINIFRIFKAQYTVL